MASIDLQLFLEAIGLCVVSLTLYRLLLSPLARLPGPKMCAITRLPLVFHEFRGKRRLFIHGLHLKYGPVVRVAPNEVSFATREAAKEIYSSGGSGYDKSPFYRLFEHFGRSNIFSTLEKGEHAERKKRFADRYSKTYVTSPDVASIVQDNADAFILKVAENLGKSLDIYVYLHCFSLDGITAHLFYPEGLHSINDENDREIMKELSFPTVLKREHLQYYFPRLWGILVGNKRRSDGRVGTYILNTSRSADVASHTVLAKLRATDDPDSDESPQSQDIPSPSQDWVYAASECMDHVLAGIDTTGDALCFLMYHLSLPTPSSQRMQARLRVELAENPGAPVDDLPYLDAVVKEGLRVYSPTPVSLPRIVPEGGRSIDGVGIPGGIIVSCQAHTMHRLDTSVFPDPEEFVPERWLEVEGAAERNQMFFAFAIGGRGCIGKHFALLEMKVLLRGVYSNYRTTVAPDMKASMEMDDQTIASRPKGQTCLVVFDKIGDELKTT